MRFALALPYRAAATHGPPMLKLIALLSAAIPVILFVRALLGRRQSKFGATLREAKTQVDFGITIFLWINAGIVAIAVARLAWSWWTAA
jgi:hypothetical protein